jgi:cytidine deaminase
MSQPIQENEADIELLHAARRAREFAVARYSGFKVGAAARLESGEIITGCNIEIASYGLTICAERVALFSAISHGARQIIRLAVSTSADNNAPIEERMPCGACRQVMIEFIAPDVKIDVDGAGTFSVGELLPIPFKLPHG